MAGPSDDLHFETMPADDLIALYRHGVPPATISGLASVRVCRGIANRSGYFDPDPHGSAFLAFEETHDIVFWHPQTGRIATLLGQAFAINEAHIDNPATYAFDCSLNIFSNPLRWLRASRDGIVITNWRHAFDRLREVPRIAVDEAILKQYERSMRPPRMPRVFVIPATLRKAA